MVGDHRTRWMVIGKPYKSDSGWRFVLVIKLNDGQGNMANSGLW